MYEEIFRDIYMDKNYSFSDPFNAVSAFEKNGKEIVDRCRKILQDRNINVWNNNISSSSNDNDEPKKDNANYEQSSSENNNNYIDKKHFSHWANPANSAYINLVKEENNFLNSNKSSEIDNSTVMNVGRLVETMDTIDEAGERHLSFLSETAPENNISGVINTYNEWGTSGNCSIFLGQIENSWQNKNKEIYTKLNVTAGYEKNTKNTSDTNKTKMVAGLSFDGRLDKEKFIYGAGVEYNSYSDNTKILDIHAAGKHKASGLGADLTRRTTITKDEETGSTSVISNMKLKVDILSNKSEDSSNPHFSFDSSSSALPSEVEDVNTNAKNLISGYIKPERKKGSDLDLEYTENKCGVTYEYNYNFIDKNDEYFSVAPTIGLHDYTDKTTSGNNESLEMTGGIITQFGKIFSNGQSFSGSVTAITDRIVKNGSKPFDSRYLLANAQYNNPKADLNASINAGALKSGNITLSYLNVDAEKQMKHSSISLCAGISRFNLNDELSNLYNVMVTYKYNFPYKTNGK